LYPLNTQGENFSTSIIESVYKQNLRFVKLFLGGDIFRPLIETKLKSFIGVEMNLEKWHELYITMLIWNIKPPTRSLSLVGYLYELYNKKDISFTVDGFISAFLQHSEERYLHSVREHMIQNFLDDNISLNCLEHSISRMIMEANITIPMLHNMINKIDEFKSIEWINCLYSRLQPEQNDELILHYIKQTAKIFPRMKIDRCRLICLLPKAFNLYPADFILETMTNAAQNILTKMKDEEIGYFISRCINIGHISPIPYLLPFILSGNPLQFNHSKIMKKLLQKDLLTEIILDKDELDLFIRKYVANIIYNVENNSVMPHEDYIYFLHSRIFANMRFILKLYGHLFTKEYILDWTLKALCVSNESPERGKFLMYLYYLYQSDNLPFCFKSCLKECYYARLREEEEFVIYATELYIQRMDKTITFVQIQAIDYMLNDIYRRQSSQFFIPLKRIKMQARILKKKILANYRTVRM
jgi:hypothetical protein